VLLGEALGLAKLACAGAIIAGVAGLKLLST
jgi:multidrug transporter EmrE-like cation transporter